jgi:glycosyltransferase involved in cell wall biosynthesis
MRILVASGLEALTMYAWVLNTVKMAQGFARLGHEVTLVCWGPSNRRVLEEELNRTYGLTEPIRWVLLPKNRIMWHSYKRKLWAMGVMALAVALWARPQLVFCREHIIPWLTSRLGLATVGEIHAPPENNELRIRRFFQATHYPGFKLLVTISHRLAQHYEERGVPTDKIIVLPDAVDLVLFRRPEELPPSPYQRPGPHVAYIGHLYDYKGIPTALATASLLPEVEFHLVGGLPEDIKRQEARIKEMGLANVTLHGLKPQVEVPPYLWHANVLLLPPSQHHPSAAWTSPLKLGEYLASGTPVVATSIPALRYWLTDEEVEFVEPDDAEAMAKSIMDVLRDPDHATTLSQNSLKKAQTLSYERRAERILEKLSLR